MTDTAFVAVYLRTITALPALIAKWPTIDAGLREHFTGELVYLLACRDSFYDRLPLERERIDRLDAALTLAVRDAPDFAWIAGPMLWAVTTRGPSGSCRVIVREVPTAVMPPGVTREVVRLDGSNPPGYLAALGAAP